MGEYREYRVSRRDQKALLDFVVGALETCRCRILHLPEPEVAPFRIVVETPDDQRLGLIVYAFPARARLRKHTFQVRYGPKGEKPHPLWQDPYGLYTTLLCGIDPPRGVFVGADPVLHSPISPTFSVDYRASRVVEILRTGWLAWEREQRRDDEDPIEVLVGGTAHSFLRYVRFEREAVGEDQGHRHLLAERFARSDAPVF